MKRRFFILMNMGVAFTSEDQGRSAPTAIPKRFTQQNHPYPMAYMYNDSESRQPYPWPCSQSLIVFLNLFDWGMCSL